MNTKVKHILFLARWYPHRYDPMFGLFIQRHAEAVALFNRVTVIYVHPDSKANGRYELVHSKQTNLNEVRVYFKKHEGLPIFSKLINQWRFFSAIFKAVKLAESNAVFDLIHIHILTRLGVLGWFLAFQRKIPYLITEHWSRYLPVNKGFKGYFRKFASRFVVKRAAMVTTVTHDLMKAMQSYNLMNNYYVVLPNVVDMKRFKPGEKIEQQKPHFVHISCFEDKSKNLSGLLRTIARLKAHGNDIFVSLIGDGMDFEAIRSYANELQINDCVAFTGLLQGDELAQKLAAADALVLFSNYENMPVVILEALACGIPVVATRVGGIPEMVDETNGILVPAGDEDALLKALITISAAYPSYNSRILRQMVEDRYGMEAVGLQLDKWYDEIIGSMAP